MKNLRKLLATALTAATFISCYSGAANAASDPTRSTGARQPNGTETIGTYVDTYTWGLHGQYDVYKGDANIDGEITMADATHILKYINARDTIWFKISGRHFYVEEGMPYTDHYYLYTYTFGDGEDYDRKLMDINCDGKITGVDATLLMRYILWRDC